MDNALTAATWALAFVTFILAVVATWQALLSRKSLQQQIDVTERDFRFETVRQTLATAPMIIVEVGKTDHRMVGKNRIMMSSNGHISLVNRGTGPAVNIRFSCLANCQTITAAQNAVPPLGQNGIFVTDIEVAADGESPFHIDQMVIRYDDVFGNLYTSEYLVVRTNGGWVSWKRPWVGKEFGLPRPAECSEDLPSWGSSGREVYELNNTLQT